MSSPISPRSSDHGNASAKQVELLELGAAGIHVAEYLTILPPQSVLENKLAQATAAARHRFLSQGS